MVLLAQGAEARVYETTLCGRPAILKERVVKKYRLPDLDSRLRRERTRQEARCIARARASGVKAPCVYLVDLPGSKLYLELIHGPTVKQWLWDHQKARPVVALAVARAIGRAIASNSHRILRLHDASVIHGDLTTSNMIMVASEATSPESSNAVLNTGLCDGADLAFIDFGLGSSSGTAEDKAVDLYVLERAFLSTHINSEPLVNELVAAYGVASKHAKKSLSRLEVPLDQINSVFAQYLNGIFPSESSLGQLDEYANGISDQIEDLDSRMSTVIQKQADARQKATEDVAEMKEAVLQLFSKISDVKSKASQSEEMVQETIHDIRMLHTAKHNLQTTVTALRRLHMLIAAVRQLELASQERRFREAANLLDAVQQLLTHFDSYSSVPRIADLRATVASVKSSLTDDVQTAFETVGHHLASSTDPQKDYDVVDGDSSTNSNMLSSRSGECCNLGEACLVVDALGEGVYLQQVSSFCEAQLSSYKTIFPRGSEEGGLEHVDSRFSWFRRLLSLVDNRFGKAFPPHWQLQHRLCLLFIQRTRDHLLEELSENSRPPEVQVLLGALQKCLAFEREAAKRFNTHRSSKESSNVYRQMVTDISGSVINGSGDRSTLGEGVVSTDSTSEQPLSSDMSEGSNKEREGGSSSSWSKKVINQPIIGSISGVFDPFMGPYIDFERQKLDELLKDAETADSTGDVDIEGNIPVLSSSMNIFVYIRQSINRCSKLTTGQTFFKLFKEFKTCLGDYAVLLRQKLPRSSGTNTIGTQQFPAVNEGEVSVCYIVNTCEYCVEVLPQLEGTVKSRVDPKFEGDVDLSSEQDAFHDVISTAIRALCGVLESRIDPSCRSMCAINWGSCEVVGEESSYVWEISEVVTEFVPIVRRLLSTLYFRAFCDKFATSFLSAFLKLILKQKRVNEMGSQQLLLDVYNLKSVMLKLPLLVLESTPPLNAMRDLDQAANTSSYTIPLSYTKFVTVQLSKIEMVLKLVGTPTAMLVERFCIMWPDGGEEDFQSIMNMKGMKRDEQLTALHALGVKTGVPSLTGANTVAHKNPDSASSKSGARILPGMTLPMTTKSKQMIANSPQSLGGIASNVKSLFRSNASRKVYNG